jgi:hypothetical protein
MCEQFLCTHETINIILILSVINFDVKYYYIIVIKCLKISKLINNNNLFFFFFLIKQRSLITLVLNSMLTGPWLIVSAHSYSLLYKRSWIFKYQPRRDDNAPQYFSLKLGSAWYVPGVKKSSWTFLPYILV